VADGDLIFQECLSHRRDEVGEPDPAIDVRLAFTRPGRDAGDGVGGLSEFEQRPESQSFLKWVDVLALQILNLSLVLKEHSTTCTTVESRTMQNLYL
jgi:hypothetical protein